MLSILIPTYNADCTALVDALLSEAETLDAPFEIVVADDGSRPEIEAANRTIGDRPHCRYLPATGNIGPARLRNRLADEARFRYLLFLDADTWPGSASFLADYLRLAQPGSVICGGFRYRRETPPSEKALRYCYGVRVEEKGADERSRQPYARFISMNFLADREVFRRVRFDDSMHFGYEDAYFGASLEQAGVPLIHAANPVFHLSLDTSTEYLAKIRTSVENLSRHIDKLRPSVRLLHWYGWLERAGGIGCVARIFRWVRPRLEANLTGNRPSMRLFAFYKLGYLCSIRRKAAVLEEGNRFAGRP